MSQPGGERTSAGRGAATRERLLQAALDVIAARGWGGVTTRSVAEAAGVNPALVHYHYASVDALRRAAIDHTMRGLVDASMRRLSGHTDPAAAVRELTGLLVTIDDRDPRLSVVLFEAFLASLRDGALRADLAALLRSTRSAVAARLAAGGTDPAHASAAAGLLIAALDGIYLHRLVDPGIDPAELVAPLAQLLVTERESP